MPGSSRTSARPSPREILLLGLWTGLAGGLGEGLFVVVASYGLHRNIFRGLDALWMAPISLASLCVLVAVPLALATRRRFGVRYPAIPFGAFGFLALLNVTPAIPKVHGAARIILVAGIATAVARLASRHANLVWRLIRGTAVPLLVLVALLAVGVRGGRWVRERRALAALPVASRDAPNVILLILDTVRAMELSLYGYTRPTTPTLDRLARRAVVFERAYAPSSWTLTSHASLFTGQPPSVTGAGWRVPLDGKLPTLAEIMGRRGYATAGFSSNSYFVTRQSGLARGFAHFEDFPARPIPILLSSSLVTSIATPIREALRWYWPPAHKHGAQLSRDVLAWLAGQEGNRPFFVFVNSFDAHSPYLPVPPFDTAFTGRRASWRDRNPNLDNDRALSQQEARTERDAYDQAIAAQDHQIGLLLDTLEAKGLLRNTLLVVSSDHGEEFAEFGLLGHGNNLNPAVVWVPLLMGFPGQLQPGVRIPEPVSLLDVAATILELADPSRQAELPGLPLLRRGIQNGTGRHSPAVAELEYAPDTPAWYQRGEGPLRAVALPGWHYQREAGGREILLDVRTDPAGRLADLRLPGVQDVLRAARTSLDSVQRRDAIRIAREPASGLSKN